MMNSRSVVLLIFDSAVGSCFFDFVLLFAVCFKMLLCCFCFCLSCFETHNKIFLVFVSCFLVVFWFVVCFGILLAFVLCYLSKASLQKLEIRKPPNEICRKNGHLTRAISTRVLTNGIFLCGGPVRR